MTDEAKGQPQEKQTPLSRDCEKPDEKQPEKQDVNVQVQQLNSQILRLRADFDNYRKRAEKEKAERYNTGKEGVLSKIIGFIDVFDKAIEMTKSADDSPKTLDGLELLKKEFMYFLEKEGVKEIKCEGQKFDPFIHEAVGSELTEDESQADKILREVSVGYMYDDRVLRNPKVIVLKKGANAAGETPEKEQRPVKEQGGN
jgi:molecular chaperone GrpE